MLALPCRVGLLAGQTEDLHALEGYLDEEKTPCFWYLTGHRIPDPAFIQALDERYELLENHALIGASARLYALPAGDPQAEKCQSRRGD